MDPGLTLVLPLLHETLPTPLLIAQVVALVIPLHVKVEDCPALMAVGLAVKFPIAGLGVVDGPDALEEQAATHTDAKTPSNVPPHREKRGRAGRSVTPMPSFMMSPSTSGLTSPDATCPRNPGFHQG